MSEGSGCMMDLTYEYKKEYKPMKTNDEVYDEIRDREEFIASKLLGKKQHAVYMKVNLYERLLKLSKEQHRSFNQQMIYLIEKGLMSEEQDASD